MTEKPLPPKVPKCWDHWKQIPEHSYILQKKHVVFRTHTEFSNNTAKMYWATFHASMNPWNNSMRQVWWCPFLGKWLAQTAQANMVSSPCISHPNAQDSGSHAPHSSLWRQCPRSLLVSKTALFPHTSEKASGNVRPFNGLQMFRSVYTCLFFWGLGLSSTENRKVKVKNHPFKTL